MEMESFMEDLLNFSVPEEEEDDEGEREMEDIMPNRNITRRKTGLRHAGPFGLFTSDDPEEEDLEWISNKDAFPVIETFVGVLPSDQYDITSPEKLATDTKQLSPVSVLEISSNSSTTTTSNSSGGSIGSAIAATVTTATTTTTTITSCCVGLNVPVKARSKRRRRGRRDLCVLWTGNHEQGIQKKKGYSVAAAAVGRKCQHCGTENTPQWRAGPSGPKTLCNACGVRYMSGRLVPEYRPASSPTFSAELHSNSHRKIVEMRKQYLTGAGDRQDCG